PLIPPPPRPLPFPYTTLFRSVDQPGALVRAVPPAADQCCRDDPVPQRVHPGGLGIESEERPLDPAHHRLVSSVLSLRSHMAPTTDRKSTRLNSSHVSISYAVF